MKIQIQKIIITLLFIQAFQIQSFAQEEGGRKWKLSEKVYFGGNFGLQLGTITSIDISPLMGYKVLSFLSVGVGGTYQYYNDNLNKYSTSIYGGSVFAEVMPIKNAFGHAEVEMLNFEDYSQYLYTGELKRTWDTGVLVGAGFRQYLGERACVNYMILWNLNETAHSLYQNPIIRIGFTF